MENCVAPSLDEFDVIIRSCIVFSQSRRSYALVVYSSIKYGPSN